MTTWIGLDGDDTLWHSERYFFDAEQRYRELLDRYVDTSDLEERMLVTERRNLDVFGYGAKAFTLSLIETAIELTGGSIEAADVHRIVELGKEILRHPTELLDGVAETLDRLTDAGHRLVIITKGDLMHQESKVAGSGLADVVDAVEIVSEKDPATYQRVTGRHGIPLGDFTMVGNSVRSDVLPVLEIGGRAVEIPYHLTWAHERVELDGEPQHLRLESIVELPEHVSPG